MSDLDRAIAVLRVEYAERMAAADKLARHKRHDQAKTNRQQAMGCAYSIGVLQKVAQR